MKNIDIEAVKKSRAGRVFYAYQETMRLCNVKRSGVDLCGVNDPSNLRPPGTKFEPFFVNHEQSDAEHCFGMIVLTYYMHRLYPEVIGPGFFRNCVENAIIHELGENPSGDIPDDGTRDNAKKDAEELDYLRHFTTQVFGEGAAESELCSFVHFVKKDNDYGIMLYLPDKFEAINRNLCFEDEGRPASLAYKLEHSGLSTKDSGDMAMTHTDLAADNWLCGLLLDDNIRNFKYTKYFVEVTLAGALMVRGRRMEWINEVFPEFAELYDNLC